MVKNIRATLKKNQKKTPKYFTFKIQSPHLTQVGTYTQKIAAFSEAKVHLPLATR